MTLAERKVAPIRMATRTAAIHARDEETGWTISLKPEYLLPYGSSKDRVPTWILSHGEKTRADPSAS
jgi:hypothetical protein